MKRPLKLVSTILTGKKKKEKLRINLRGTLEIQCLAKKCFLTTV